MKKKKFDFLFRNDPHGDILPFFSYVCIMKIRKIIQPRGYKHYYFYMNNEFVYQ